MTLTNSPSSEEPPQIALIKMMFGAWISQAIYVVASLGIADLLQNGDKSVADLAQKTDTHPPYLYRILRALACVGIFTEVEPQKFALTDIAKCLQSDVPGSLRALSMMLGDEWNWHSWGDILSIIKTGKPALNRLYNVENAFEYFAKHPESGKLFNDAMSGFSYNVHTAVVDAYNFSDISTIVDIAGGHGTLISSILTANPSMKGILFDLPSVISGATETLQNKGVLNRCKTISGDFFQSVPLNGDAYILSNIIHDWDDKDCIRILKNIHQSIVKNGKLLVVEMVVPPNDIPHLSKLLDLEMLIMYPGGRERTKTEFHQLYETAGFHLTRIIPTMTPVSIIEGVCA